MNQSEDAIENEIRRLYETTRTEFKDLMTSIPRTAWNTQSLNPGWTNGEILTHIFFGFLILRALLPISRFWAKFPRKSSRWFARLLNLLTKPFNWINALGARGQAKVFRPDRIGVRFDRVIGLLLSQLDRIRDDEWGRGMYSPTRWDPNFKEFMTLEALFRYPVAHFRLHRDQIAKG